MSVVKKTPQTKAENPSIVVQSEQSVSMVFAAHLGYLNWKIYQENPEIPGPAPSYPSPGCSWGSGDAGPEVAR